MLQDVRKYTQGWVATFLAVLLSLAFVMWGIENYLRGGSKKDLAAKVNGVEISANQLNVDYNRMILKIKQEAGPGFVLSPILQQQIKSEALNNRISQAVLIQAAAKTGFIMTPFQAISIIKQMPQFQEKGHFSKNRFDAIIAQLEYSRATFIAEVTQTLLLSQVAFGIVESAFVLPNELNQALSLLGQKRDFEYAILPSSAFKQPLSPNSILKYYEQHKNEFKAPAKLQIEYLELSANELKKNIKISDQELNEYFGSNAELSSKDPKQISKAKDYLTQQKIEQEFISASDKLTDLTYTNSSSLIDAANELGLKVQTSEYFTHQGGSSSLTKNPKILNTAFSNDFIKSGSNSNLIEIAPGTVIVMRVKDYQSESIMPLAKVKDKIKAYLLAQEASKRAENKGQSMLQQIHNKGEFKKVVIAAGFKVIQKQQISREQKEINPQLLKVAFSMAPGEKAAGVKLENGDYAVVILEQVMNLPSSKITPLARSNMDKVYSELYGKAEYDRYILNQMNHAKIKTFKSVS